MTIASVTPQIRWGTNFENVLEVPIFDNIVTGRRPREGSVQGRAGVDVSWVEGWDYWARGDARWIPDQDQTSPFVATGWSGPTGWQAFLDWARQWPNVFRFHPDRTLSDFYVDNCSLEELFEEEAGQLEQDGTRSVSITMRNATVDFSQALRGIMFEYAPGASLTDPVAATFSRASTATRIAKDGSLASELANVLRDRHYEGALKTALLEASRINLIENGDYEADAVGSTLGGGSTILRDNAQARFGSWSLKVTTANVLGSGVFWTKRDGSRMAAAASTVYTKSLWVYAPAASVGKTLRFQVEWWDASPALISLVPGSPFTLVAGWQRVDTAFPASPVGTVTARTFFETDAAEGVFDFWVDVVQFEAGAFASSAILTGTGAVTRSADVFSRPFTHKPQAMYAYIKFVERGTVLLTDVRALWSIGVRASNAIYVDNAFGGGNYRVVHQETGNSQGFLSSPPIIGDVVELLVILNANGSVQIKQVKNGGSEIASSVGGALALPGAWTNATLSLDSFDAGAIGIGFNAFAQAKFGPLAFGGVTRDTIPKARAA